MMSNKISVAIIIVNFNGTDDTIECLRSIDNTIYHKGEVNYEIILVDNGSRNPIIISDISGVKSKVHLISSTKNLGFAGGNNFGLQYIMEHKIYFDMLLLLNNDTILVDDSISRLAIMLNSSSFGIGGAINYYFSNPNEIWQAGNLFRPNRLKGITIKSNIEGNDFIKVDFVPGSSMMIKKEVIDQVGFLDDRFFAYYEEMDMSIRASRFGYETGFLQSTKILHKVGKSSPSVLKHYLRTRNTLLFYEKNYPELMHNAKVRILVRTILVFLKSKCSFNFIKAYFIGKRDYKERFFYEGHIASFK